MSVCVYMSVYGYICVCMYVYIFVCIYVCVYMYSYMTESFMHLKLTRPCKPTTSQFKKMTPQSKEYPAAPSHHHPGCRGGDSRCWI